MPGNISGLQAAPHDDGTIGLIGNAVASYPGVTGAVVMLTLTLSTLGLPLAGVGLLLAIDPILDVERLHATSTVEPLARVERTDGVDEDLREPVTV